MLFSAAQLHFPLPRDYEAEYTALKIIEKSLELVPEIVDWRYQRAVKFAVKALPDGATASVDGELPNLLQAC